LRQIDTSSGTPITIAIIAINALFFAYQISQDAVDNPVNLIRVGALYSPLIEAGQWWRLLTAQFIHWGVAHLALNMLGLWFLGRTVERTLGSNRYIVSYLLCGAGGMTIAWLANFVTNMGNPMILLGASASVLGMVGLQAATSLMAYRKTGSVIAKAQLSAMTQIIALQVIFDLSVPQVSSTAHIGGAACGFIIGMFLTRRARTNIIVEH
jgi:rhomboid protease GluP